MAHDSEKVLCCKLKNSNFSIQVDESTDLANKCHVVAFGRFVNQVKFKKTSYVAKNCLNEQRNRFIQYNIKFWQLKEK